VLDAEERVVELARMLAGHEDSAAAREHARELVRGAVL
jgi:DNA repair protein RecN (Recombination protein N)